MTENRLCVLIREPVRSPNPLNYREIQRSITVGGVVLPLAESVHRHRHPQQLHPNY